MGAREKGKGRVRPPQRKSCLRHWHLQGLLWGVGWVELGTCESIMGCVGLGWVM